MEIEFVKKNKTINKVIDLIEKEQNIEQKIAFLQNLSFLAVHSHFGFFTNEKIEIQLEKISKNFKAKENINNNNNKFLHILTKSYKTGGHTRVVEGILFNRKDTEEIHDTLIVSQGKEEKPELLKNLSNKIIDLDNDYKDKMSNIDKINKIIDISSEYENIVLHLHMFDVLPIIALWTYKNIKNIYLYNHADHLFWIGKSLPDKVFEMGKESLDFSNKYRGIYNNTILPLPLIKPIEIENKLKLKLKKDLNISNEKIILSIGNIERYKEIDTEYNYKKLINNVLKKDKNIKFIIVGNTKDKWWEDILNNDNVIFTGPINKDKLEIYYSIADIYIDSFPRGGNLASIGSIPHNVPLIKVKSNFLEIDSLKPYLVEKKEIENRIFDILNNKISFETNIEVHFKDKWNPIWKNSLKIENKNKNDFENIIENDSYSKELLKYQMKTKEGIIHYSILNLNSINKLKYIYTIFFYCPKFILKFIKQFKQAIIK